VKVALSDEAFADLEAAVDYLSHDDPAVAAHLAERVFDVAERLADGEYEGPETRLSTGDVVRSWPVHPYRLYYTRAHGRVYLVRIYHQRRKPL